MAHDILFHELSRTSHPDTLFQFYAPACAEIYNSAIRLFAEKDRACLEPEAFRSLLEQDEMITAELAEGSAKKMAAFLCYHPYGTDCELTAFYVALDAQRRGLGKKLLQALEQNLTPGSLLFVKVLKNAPWSLRFYEKNGFLPLFVEKENGTEPKPVTRQKQAAEAIGLTEKPWSKIYYKQIC